MEDFNLREKAEIVSMSIDAKESLDSRELTKWYVEKLSKPIMQTIYSNLQQEMDAIKERAGSTLTEAILSLDGHLEIDDLEFVKCGVLLMSTQLSLLEHIPESIRDMAFEATAREWSLIDES